MLHSHLNRVDAIVLLLFLSRTVELWRRWLLLSNLPKCPQMSHLVLQVPCSRDRTSSPADQAEGCHLRMEELYHCQTYAANPLANHVLDLAFLLQPELSGITFIIAQVYLPVLRQTALLSPSASFSTPCSNNVPSLPATGLFSLVRDWFSVCAMLCSVKGERGSDHLWPGTGHYNKQRVTIQARLKGRQEVLVRTWVGFILIHVTYDRISLGSGGVILEHNEGHSRIEMDNLDISIQPGRGAVRRQSVFQGSSVIKL